MCIHPLTSFSRYCTTILSALQLYVMTRRRLTLALQHLSSPPHISLTLVHVPRLFTCIEKLTKKLIHYKNTPCVFLPRAAPELPNAQKYLHVSPHRLNFNPTKIITSVPCLLFHLRGCCSVCTPLVSSPPPLTPSMVTLLRQRGHSHTTVHVHVRWDLPTHGPHTWTARVPNTVQPSRISAPSPHLNSSW